MAPHFQKYNCATIGFIMIASFQWRFQHNKTEGW